MIRIKRALVSVTDKSGLDELALALQSLDVEIIASQGTGAFLQKLGVAFTPLAQLSGYDQAFGGRCKSLSLHVMGGVLFDRERHAQEAKKIGVAPIDMVVCNLYDFGSAWADGAASEQLVEQIDIGGVALLRASAKNCNYVVSASDPADYHAIIAQMQETGGVSKHLAKSLAVKSFVACSEYDRLVALGFGGQSLRYGENPHQKAWSYALPEFGFLGLKQLQGNKELSYNNFLDIKAGLDCLQGAQGKSCVIIKHGNPCGFCQSKKSKDGLLATAWAGDSISAFGSIIGFSMGVDVQDLQFLALSQKNKSKFVEVVLAPEFTPAALEYLGQKKNLRVCSYQPRAAGSGLAFRQLGTMLLAQEQDIAGKAVQALCSNAVTLVYRDSQQRLTQVAMGCGQPNRLDAIELALRKLKRSMAAGDFRGKVEDCYLVSDAFLPFADNVQAVAASGIKTIVQPGGSINDAKVLNACQELGIRMVFSGVRHFRH